MAFASSFLLLELAWSMKSESKKVMNAFPKSPCRSRGSAEGVLRGGESGVKIYIL
jgi:hypothetical protein